LVTATGLQLEASARYIVLHPDWRRLRMSTRPTHFTSWHSRRGARPQALTADRRAEHLGKSIGNFLFASVKLPVWAFVLLAPCAILGLQTALIELGRL
jgi:hypothetical protein